MNNWNDLPCFGLVNTSAHISSVVHNYIFNFPLSTVSLTITYLALICLVLFPIEPRPFISISMVDILSWYIILCSTVYTCPSINYLVQITCTRAPYAPTNSPSVEIFTFNFFLLYMLITAPSLRVSIALVCPWQPSCVLYDVSTHYFTIDSESTLMASFICFLAFSYFKQLLISSSRPHLVSLLLLLKMLLLSIYLLSISAQYKIVVP